MRRLTVLLTLVAAMFCYVAPALAATPVTHSSAAASKPKAKAQPQKKAAHVAPKPHAAQPAKWKPTTTPKKPSKHGSTARVRPATKK